ATLIKEALAERRRRVPADSLQLAGLLARSATIVLEAKAWTAAETILRESLAIREKAEPDAWTTFNTKAMLGGALLGQEKYGDAEPLMREGYEGMKQRRDKIPAQSKDRLTRALEWLIELADATGKLDDAERWKS